MNPDQKHVQIVLRKYPDAVCEMISPIPEKYQVRCSTAQDSECLCSGQSPREAWEKSAEMVEIGVSGWQPIATVPKGVPVDIWTEGFSADACRVACCYYDGICDEWRTSRPRGQLHCVPSRFVTHWMPMPPPPGGKSPSNAP